MVRVYPTLTDGHTSLPTFQALPPSNMFHPSYPFGRPLQAAHPTAGTPYHLAQKHQAMKTLKTFFPRCSADSWRNVLLLVGAFDEDWIRHLRSFECLCAMYALFEADSLELPRITQRADALDFYDNSTRTTGISYRGIIDDFKTRYHSPTRREGNSKMPSALSLASTRGAEMGCPQSAY